MLNGANNKPLYTALPFKFCTNFGVHMFPDHPMMLGNFWSICQLTFLRVDPIRHFQISYSGLFLTEGTKSIYRINRLYFWISNELNLKHSWQCCNVSCTELYWNMLTSDWLELSANQMRVIISKPCSGLRWPKVIIFKL